MSDTPRGPPLLRRLQDETSRCCVPPSLGVPRDRESALKNIARSCPLPIGPPSRGPSIGCILVSSIRVSNVQYAPKGLGHTQAEGLYAAFSAPIPALGYSGRNPAQASSRARDGGGNRRQAGPYGVDSGATVCPGGTRRGPLLRHRMVEGPHLA